MLRTSLICSILLLSCLNPAHGLSFKIKRVCQTGNNNTLFWSVSGTDTCNAFRGFYVYGSTDTFSNVYSLLDSSKTFADSQLTHLNGKSIQKYFIRLIFNCGSDSSLYDSAIIDTEKPALTLLDSASVDFNTGKIYLGWRANPSPDFNYYEVYYKAALLTSLTQTFYIDNVSGNPNAEILEYDMTSIDHCGNRNVTFNPHRTIFLQATIDTCVNKATLAWSPYVGWPSLRKYEIMRSSDGGNSFIRIDSVTSSTLSYSDNVLSNSSYQYFIRAFRGDTVPATSSSNAVTVISSTRKDPENTYINYVSTTPGGNEISIFPDATAISKSIEIHRKESGGPFVLLEILTNNLSLYLDATAKPRIRYVYEARAQNICSITTNVSNRAQNIVLTVDSIEFETLNWNSYSTWNTGVNRYEIFKYSGDPAAPSKIYSPLIQTVDTTYKDTILPKPGEVNCYYILAIQNPGSPFGNVAGSKSNEKCGEAEFSAYFPNALNISGINNIFKPNGIFIDYSLSEIEVYNAWGSLIYGKRGLEDGWDGRDLSGNWCPQGLYFFKARVLSLKGAVKLFQGSILLIN